MFGDSTSSWVRRGGEEEEEEVNEVRPSESRVMSG